MLVTFRSVNLPRVYPERILESNEVPTENRREEEPSLGYDGSEGGSVPVCWHCDRSYSLQNSSIHRSHACEQWSRGEPRKNPNYVHSQTISSYMAMVFSYDVFSTNLIHVRPLFRKSLTNSRWSIATWSAEMCRWNPKMRKGGFSKWDSFPGRSETANLRCCSEEVGRSFDRRAGCEKVTSSSSRWWACHSLWCTSCEAIWKWPSGPWRPSSLYVTLSLTLERANPQTLKESWRKI